MKSIAIILKPLTEEDLPLLYNWFQKPHIKQLYARGEDYSLEMIKKNISQGYSALSQYPILSFMLINNQ